MYRASLRGCSPRVRLRRGAATAATQVHRQNLRLDALATQRRQHVGERRFVLSKVPPAARAADSNVARDTGSLLAQCVGVATTPCQRGVSCLGTAVSSAQKCESRTEELRSWNERGGKPDMSQTDFRNNEANRANAQGWQSVSRWASMPRRSAASREASSTWLLQRMKGLARSLARQ